MSHFTVMVIGDDPELQLEPYDENLDTPEYSRGEVSDEDREQFLQFYKERDTNNELEDKSFEEIYKIHGDDWNRNAWRPDENGVFQEYSNYNPKSKWDWYQLGGRWSGLIKLKEGAEGIEGESGVFDNETGIDAAYKKDIANLDQIRPFAVLKDGEWYERGEMGWWAIVANEKDTDVWEAELKKLLDGLPDDTLISIYDCHI